MWGLRNVVDYWRDGFPLMQLVVSFSDVGLSLSQNALQAFEAGRKTAGLLITSAP